MLMVGFNYRFNWGLSDPISPSEGTLAGNRAGAAAAHDYSIHIYDQTGRLMAAPMPIFTADDDATAIAWSTAHVKGLDAEVMDSDRVTAAVESAKF
jgi:hypothetical protein